MTATNVLEFSSTPQIVLTDAPTGLWTITLQKSDLASLKPKYPYRYELRSKLGTADHIVQVSGEFVLKPWLKLGGY